jgi:hypothetical protein
MNYKITINGKPFNCANQFISGKQLRKIGNLPSTIKIWFKVNKSDLKLEINNLDTIDLVLSRPEIFFSTIK